MVDPYPTRVRKRDRRAPDTVVFTTHSEGHTTTGPPGGTNLSQTTNWRACLWTRREWCEDSNHRQTYVTIPGPSVEILKGTMTRKDSGGPLWLRRSTREHFPTPVPTFETHQGTEGPGNWTKGYEAGYQMIGGASFGSGLTSNTGTAIVPTYGTVPSKSLIDFGLWGPKAWERYKPLNPKVSTSQFVAELRQLPSLFFHIASRWPSMKGLGKDYLNVQFGWLPFLRDVKDFILAVFNFQERWAQVLKDNEKPVHREGPVMKTEQSEITSSSSGIGFDILAPAFSTAAYVKAFGSASAVPWSKTVTTTISQKYWFSGTFRYYIQPIGSLRYYEQMARIAYGVDLTPRLLWELMPWSWLADWVSSFGASISNLTEYNIDNLVAEYAYTMGHYVVSTETAWSNGWGTARFVQTDEVKARNQATPFGFGVSLGSFTLRQQAILAALALSRM